MSKVKINKSTAFYIYLFQILFGIIWLKSSLPKFIDNKFVTNISQTLTFFASKNPLAFYKSFLVNFALPRASMFAQMTRLGEMTAGVILTYFGIKALLSHLNVADKLLVKFGLGVGMFLSINFYLAAFWTSTAVETLNLLMFFSQLIILLFY